MELQHPTKESNRKIKNDFCAYTVISMSAESHAWLVKAFNAYAENYENMPESSKIERFIQKEMEKIVKE